MSIGWGRLVIAVVGGGITGAFAAFAAARAGVGVTLIDATPPNGAASANNPGGLNPMHGAGIPGPLSSIALVALDLHRAAWPVISDATDLDFAARPAERLHLAFDAAEADRLQASAAVYNANVGFSATWLDADAAHAREPRLGGGVIGALLATGNVRVDAASYLAAVRAAAVAAGAVALDARVTGTVGDGGRVVAVETDRGALDCDAIIVATGPWCAEPASWLDLDLDAAVEPVRGEMLLVPAPTWGLDTDITSGAFGIYPNPDGTVWLGGTEDRAGYDATATPEGRAAIIAATTRLHSGVATDVVLRHTTALRPVTRDGLPIAGLAPGWSNVALALGSGRKGMLLSAALGQAAADLLTAGTTNVPIDGFELDRPGLAA